MLLEYVWCDKVDVYGKNSSENASVRKYVCFACLPYRMCPAALVLLLVLGLCVID